MATITTSEDSNESKSMPRGKIPESFKKWLKWLMLIGACVLAIVCIASLAHRSGGQKQSEKAAASAQSSIPFESEPGATWPKLTLPPKVGGRVSIPLEPGKSVVIDGDNLHVHSVYSNGHECVRASEGAESETVCPNGGIVETYVTNKIEKEHRISYAYVPL